MLQVFHLDISKVDLVLQLLFHMHVLCVSSTFRCMLQVLHSDVSKIDRVLHLYLRFSAASPSPRCLLLPTLARHPPSSPPLLDAGVATCCSHLLQLLAGRVHAREKRRGHERGLSTCSRAVRASRRRARDTDAQRETKCRCGHTTECLGASTVVRENSLCPCSFR